jgi:hypothetical protein
MCCRTGEKQGGHLRLLSLVQAGAHAGLSATDAWRRAAVGDGKNVAQSSQASLCKIDHQIALQKKMQRVIIPRGAQSISEHVVVVLAPFAGWGRSRRAFENQLGHGSADYLARSASDRRPASVIRTRATSIGRPPATMRSVFAVASPARIRSTSWNAARACRPSRRGSRSCGCLQLHSRQWRVVSDRSPRTRCRASR